MRILLAHNRYQQRGGEDVVFESERALLERAGHEVFVYERHNDEIRGYSAWEMLDLSRRTVWATDSTSSIREILFQNRPDVAYFFNTFPLISPAAYYACASAGVPVVQNLANYRLVCPSSDFLRDGSPCELCLSKAVAWPGILHRCYKDSWGGSAVVASMLAFHRIVRTWKVRVATYVALTEFSRRKYVAGGLPAEKIVVKPNFIDPDPGPRTRASDYALFVGRLSKEKGISTLLRAWEDLPGTPLKIAGDGPQSAVAEEASKRRGESNIEILGWRTREEVIDLIKGAAFLVIPSECYEAFPLTIVEAFACGVPVIGSRLGAIGEVVRHGFSGLLFESGNSTELGSMVRRLTADTELRNRLGRGARSEYTAHYTAERNYDMMMGILKNASKRRRSL